MIEETPIMTEFKGSHDGCPVSVPHRHDWKRVMSGYVLGRVILSPEVINVLVNLLKSDRPEERQYAARNLQHSPAGLSLVPLEKALACEKDSFTAGLLIAALGSLGRREVVAAIDSWAKRAEEGLIAQNIIQSYLMIWIDTGCTRAESDRFCERIWQTFRNFAHSHDPLIAEEARRVIDSIVSND